MQSGLERRMAEAPRFPLDLLVQLSHEDYDEPFDADSVDVSARGLCLRADYLPEVGDRLRMRFDCPPSGVELEVDGEVVWAQDAGERSGEFGVRFREVEADAEEGLRELLELLRGVDQPQAPGADAEARPVAGRARLHLDGVPTPIEAEVVTRGPEGLVVEQPLPFLRIGMGVSVEGSGPARAALRSVELRLEDGVPRLVLGVRDLDAEVAEAAPVAEAEPRSRVEAPDSIITSAPEDATLRDHVFAPEAETAGEPLEAADTQDDLPIAEGQAEEEDPILAAALEKAERASRQPTPRSSEEAPAEHELATETAETSAPGRLAPLIAAAALVGARLRSWRAQAGPWFRENVAPRLTKVMPALRAVGRLIAAAFASAKEKLGPRASAFFAAIGPRAAAMSSALRSRLSRGRRRTTSVAKPRKTTAPVKRRQQGARPAVAEPEPENHPRWGRRVLALALVLGAAAAIVYAFAGEGEAELEPEPVAVHRELPTPSAPAASPRAASPSAVEAAEAETPAEEAGEPEATEAEAGRLGAPTYPSLREAAPSANASAEEGTTFGAAEVPEGRARTLRMSQPVSVLRGQREPDGFTVTIPGALALDRAQPIAALNPSVERASILNRGDHAVLTVRFVAGRQPAYRVSARGQAIEVVIGR